MELDSPDRPAEIEITEDMLAAGYAAIARWLPDTTDFNSPEWVREVLSRVFSEMARRKD